MYSFHLLFAFFNSLFYYHRMGGSLVAIV